MGTSLYISGVFARVLPYLPRVLFLVLITSGSASAQSTSWIQDAWTVDDGLPQNSVNDLLIDADGFLWIATYDGLARFDGTEFMVYRSADTPGLPSDRVTTLSLAPDGAMWIGTEGGISILQDDRFRAFTRDDGLPNAFVNAIATGPGNTVWISTAGANEQDLIRMEDGSPHPVTDTNGASPAGEILFIDAFGTPWSTSRTGITQLRSLRTQTLLDGTQDAIKGVYESGTGIMMVGTEAGRLFARRPDNTFEPWKTVPGIVEARQFAPDPTSNGLWVGTEGRITHFDGDRITDSIPLAGRASSMIMSLLPADDGTLWVGTNGQGLVRIKPALITVVGAADGLTTDVALSVTEDTDGTVWIGTNCGGVFRIRDQQASPLRTPFVPSNACVYAVMGASNGDVFIGHRNLVRYRDGSFAAFDQQHGLPGNPALRSDFIIALYEDPADPDVVWVGTQQGFRRFEDGSMTTPSYTGELLHPHVRGFLRDSRGRLWIATRGGANILDGSVMESVTIEDGLPSNDVRAFHEDRNGSMWIGTYGGGLAHWTADSIQTVAHKDGLFENVISSISESNGMLWTSGNQGIARVALDSLHGFLDGQVTSVNGIGYQKEAGLLISETNGGFQPSSWMADDGRIWYPTLAGAAMLDPAIILSEQQPPDVHLSGLTVSNQEIPISGAIRLPLGDRNFEIQYAGIDLSAPKRLTYRYRLAEFDRDWVPADSRREAVFTNVPPGSYTFQVQAANREGIWGPVRESATIVVPAHVYERSVFRVGLLLLVIVVVAGLVRRRTVEAARREQKLNELVTERTAALEEALQKISEQADQLRHLDQAKARFFADTSHEFRSPLTLIIGPLQRMLDDADRRGMSEDTKRELTVVKRNAQRLLDLINQLLKLAKFDAGSLMVDPEWVNLVPVVRSRIGMFRSLASVRHITLEFLHHPADIRYRVDVGAFETIIMNVLSNALECTPEGGTVILELQQHGDGSVSVHIKDSGPGFDEETLPHLFSRFSETSGTTESAGLGLAIVKEYVSMHGGEIRAENRPSGGAHVHVAFPPLADPPAPPPATDAHDISQALSEPSESEDGLALILVVDDHDDIRDYIVESLDGYDVLEARHAEDGLELAREHVPDAIISDVMMPGMDGMQFCRELRADTRTSHIPIMLLTARADSESRLEGLHAGADAYLEKPFRARELNAQVTNLLELRQRISEHLSRTLLAETQSAAVETPSQTQVRTEESAFVTRVWDIIGQNLENNQFGVDALAEEVSLGRRQLSRKLAALTDMSPSVMIRQARMQRAAELLASGNATINDVAARVGYSSASSFSQAFQAHFGYAPSDAK